MSGSVASTTQGPATGSVTPPGLHMAEVKDQEESPPNEITRASGDESGSTSEPESPNSSPVYGEYLECPTDDEEGCGVHEIVLAPCIYSNEFKRFCYMCECNRKRRLHTLKTCDRRLFRGLHKGCICDGGASLPSQDQALIANGPFVNSLALGSGEFEFVDVVVEDQVVSDSMISKMQDSLIDLLISMHDPPQSRQWHFINYSEQELAHWTVAAYVTEFKADLQQKNMAQSLVDKFTDSDLMGVPLAAPITFKFP